jgi:uncharacterized coiled-coil DUF342 family protein
MEALELKSERDKINENVRWLKQQRTELNSKFRGKIEEAKKLREQRREMSQKAPRGGFSDLQKELEDIEWKIQTTSMDLKEEREHVERVKQLEIQLAAHRKSEKLHKRISDLQSEIDNIQAEGKRSHDKLTELAQKSQEIHEKMIAKVAESKKIKAEADGLHHVFVLTREQMKPLQEEIAAVASQLKRLKAEVHEEEEKEKRKAEETLREKLETQAKEKLKRGEKLTWEEFQVLAEKGMEAQDQS